MIKNFLLISMLLISTAFGGLPPTTSKFSGDAADLTTFKYRFPGMAGSHSGTTATFSNTFTTDVTSTDYLFSDPNYNTLSTKKQLSYQMATGVTDGSLLSINANPALFDLSAQVLMFNDYSTSLENTIPKVVTCPAQLAVAVTFLASADSSYVSVAPNCAIIQSATFPTPTQRRTNAFIGRLSHSNHTSLSFVSDLPDLAVDTNSQLYDLFDAIGAFNVGGNVLTPNGANLSFNRSGGVIFRRSSNYANNKQNPHTIATAAATPQSFLRATQTTVNSTPFSVIDPGNYDVAGTITAIPGANARATNKRVYLFSNGVVGVQYGQAFYANISDALAGLPNETFVVNPQAVEGGVLVGIITCRKVATDISLSTDCIISKVGRFDQSGVTAGAIATTTMQQGYDISVSPQVTTTTPLGAIDYKRGSAADTDNVFRILNGAGTATATITGAGIITGSNLTGTNTGDLQVQGQTGGGTAAASAVRAPYRQMTQTAASAWLVETDSENMLANPSFENQTVGSGWTLGTSNTLTADASSASQFSGLQAAFLQTSATVAFDLRQNVTPTDGLANQQGFVSWAVRVPVGVTDGQVCSLVNNVIQNCVSTINNNIYREYFIPTVFGTAGQSVGVLFKTTATYASGSQIVVVDKARVRVGLPQQNLMGDTVYNGTSTSAGVVSDDDTDWVNGNASISNTSDYLITFNPGKFTVAPKCWAIITGTQTSRIATVVSTSATAVTFRTAATGGLEANSFNFYCKKSGVDYVNAMSSSFVSAGSTLRNTTLFSLTGNTTSGTITNENQDFVNGNGTAANGTAITFNAGIFTVTPNCEAAPVGTSTAVMSISGLSSTGVTVTSYNPTTLALIASQSFVLQCQKTGVDYTAAFTPFIVGSFSGVPSVPGYEGKVDTFKFSYGTTAATTVCSANPCSYLDQLGTGGVTSVARGVGGNYTPTFGKTYAKLKCVGGATGGVLSSTVSPINCTNCNSSTFVTYNSTTGAAQDTYGTLDCTGTY